MTREKAEAKVKELTESVPIRIWCPLTAMSCRIDCICYSKAVAREVKWSSAKSFNYCKGTGVYIVEGGTCGNYMFGE